MIFDHFGSHFGDFWGSGEIVKIELSRESELNPEGWRVSETDHFWSLFPDLPQNVPKGVPKQPVGQLWLQKC